MFFKIIAATMGLAAGVGSVDAASFDCSKAAVGIETTICRNQSLSLADETLAEQYDKLAWLTSADKPALAELAGEQKNWLVKQRNPCKDNVDCLTAAYNSRFSEIQQQVQAFNSAKPAAIGKAELDAPIGGWRHSSGESMRYVQKVTYPVADVNTEDNDSPLALIKGRIASNRKAGEGDGQPLNLVVNGVAMPLKTDGGEFERPYAFGYGSNSVEILSPEGKSLVRTQFYEAYSEKTSPKLRILLSWDSDGTDVDLHVITPDGEHCYYGNRVLKNGGALDVDVTTGYGPEIFSMPSILPGTYLVYVNYYGSYGDNSQLTAGKVSVITGDGTPDEKVQTLTVPLRHPGDLALVHSFRYP
jgi:uncharacterized protein YfaP (DUF2135 family)